MNTLLIRIFICILTTGSFIYAYLTKQNSITRLRFDIPALSKELEEIKQENIRLQFEIDRFESPDHLIELARKPEFRHLKHPILTDITEISVREK